MEITLKTKCFRHIVTYFKDPSIRIMVQGVASGFQTIHEPLSLTPFCVSFTPDGIAANFAWLKSIRGIYWYIDDRYHCHDSGEDGRDTFGLDPFKCKSFTRMYRECWNECTRRSIDNTFNKNGVFADRMCKNIHSFESPPVVHVCSLCCSDTCNLAGKRVVRTNRTGADIIRIHWNGKPCSVLDCGVQNFAVHTVDAGTKPYPRRFLLDDARKELYIVNFHQMHLCDWVIESGRPHVEHILLSTPLRSQIVHSPRYDRDTYHIFDNIANIFM
jgi:hypothetical protein